MDLPVIRDYKSIAGGEFDPADRSFIPALNDFHDTAFGTQSFASRLDAYPYLIPVHGIFQVGRPHIYILFPVFRNDVGKPRINMVYSSGYELRFPDALVSTISEPGDLAFPFKLCQHNRNLPVIVLAPEP